MTDPSWPHDGTPTDRGWTAPGGGPAPAPGAWQSPGDGAYPQDRRPSAPGGSPPAQPGVVPLRPLRFGDIFEGAFRVLKFNPRTMFGLSFVVLALTMLVIAVVSYLAWAWMDGGPVLDVAGGQMSGGFSTITNFWSLGLSLVTFILSGLLLPAVVGALRGVRTRPGQAWAEVKGRIPALIGYGLISLVIYLLVLAPLIGAVVALGIGLGDGGSIGVVLGLILAAFVVFLVAVVVISTYLALASPAIVLERVGPLAGIRRSLRLVRGSFWRILGILLLTSLLTGVVSGVVTGVVMAIAMAVFFAVGQAAGALAGVAFLGLYALMVVVVSTFTLPFTSTVTALLYLDRRFRTEGLAVDLAREASTYEQGSPGR